MISDKQEIFNNFMNEFVKLDIQSKNSEIVSELKTVLSELLNIARERNIEYQFLKSKEINDITDNKGDNEDYLEAIMVYVENIKELIGLLLINVL